MSEREFDTEEQAGILAEEIVELTRQKPPDLQSAISSRINQKLIECWNASYEAFDAEHK